MDEAPVSRFALSASSPGLTRRSSIFVKRWMPGSSPGMTQHVWRGYLRTQITRVTDSFAASTPAVPDDGAM
jgi:hypothetical protein